MRWASSSHYFEWMPSLRLVSSFKAQLKCKLANSQ